MYLSGDLIPEAPCNVMVRWDWDPPEVSPIEPHKHDVDEILLFLAMGPEEDLAAEADITLGEDEEAEIHAITRTSLVYIPAGLQHGPMSPKNFDKSKRHCCAISFLLQPDYL